MVPRFTREMSGIMVDEMVKSPEDEFVILTDGKYVTLRINGGHQVLDGYKVSDVQYNPKGYAFKVDLNKMRGIGGKLYKKDLEDYVYKEINRILAIHYQEYKERERAKELYKKLERENLKKQQSSRYNKGREKETDGLDL